MKIIVNGAGAEVDGAEISYRDVERIAFNGKDDRGATITYHNGPGKDGELVPGETVPIAEGMIFNVFVTGG